MPSKSSEQPTSLNANFLQELQERAYVEEFEPVFDKIDPQRLVPDSTAGPSKGQISPGDCFSVKGLCEFRVRANESGFHEDEGVDNVADLARETHEFKPFFVSNCSCLCRLTVDDESFSWAGLPIEVPMTKAESYDHLCNCFEVISVL